MKILANVIGILAVIMFVISYQLKSRRSIIFFNAGSRILYIAQYLLLGAFEGALLDTVAFLISLVYRAKDTRLIKNHLTITLIVSNLFIVGLGMTTYQNVYSLLPIIGVIFETLGLWLTKEKHIRLVSLLGAPPWLVYNFISGAYGSVIGNVITLVSIAVAIVRYDVLKRSNAEPQIDPTPFENIQGRG